MVQKIVAIALGDPAGIGPEIALKAAADARTRAACRPLLVGDRRAIDAHAKACGIDVEVRNVSSPAEALALPDNVVALWHHDLFGNEELRLGEISGLHGRVATQSAAAAIAAAMRGDVAAVVAAPQTEKAIQLAGIEFDGYPTFVARCTGTPVDDAYLMLCFDEKRIVHVTLHVSVRKALDLITRERVQDVLEATAKVLRHFGISHPRIAVGGLNPHASEHGLFGNDEAEIIEPAMVAARATTGAVIEGPFGADTMFHKSGYDAFIVMIHDQGHLAAKLLATNRTAGLTIGTPILFSSVAHGSALDIAGQNKASPEAVIEAVRRLAGAPALAQAAE